MSRPLRIAGIGAVLLMLVIDGWFLDAQRLPEFRDCDPTATPAQWQRCVDVESTKIQPRLEYTERVKWWRGAAVLVIVGTAAASLVTALTGWRTRRRT